MTELTVQTRIAAPSDVCFDLARNVEFHAQSLAHTGERLVFRPPHTLLKLGDEVEFEGRHLGVRQRLRARITALEAPTHFRDEMVRGAFRVFTHDHTFEAVADGTLMTDHLRFSSPGGPLSGLIERYLLRPYLRRLIAARGQEIRRAAEEALSAA